MNFFLSHPSFLYAGHPLFVTRLISDEEGDEGTHTHPHGQLYCLERGMSVIEHMQGRWSVSPHQLGWIPPHTAHRAHDHGALAGWAAYLAPELCGALPSKACVLCGSSLIPPLMERILGWNGDTPLVLTPARERLLTVLFDELAAAPPVTPHLPFPVDERLLRVVTEVIRDPADNRSIEAWSRLAAMSPRSFVRHFIKETGLSFGQWRQSARLLRAQERLAKGTNVQETAWSLGYETPSAFIAAFRKAFGITPRQYTLLCLKDKSSKPRKQR